MKRNKISVDILICGGGSAGFGAAYSACLHSGGRYSVAVIDKNRCLGGASTAGGVNAWEMGIGGPGVHEEIAKRLLDDGTGAILKGHWEALVRTRPYALHSPSTDYTYKDTLKAAGIHDRTDNHNSFMFEPDAMASLMLEMLVEAGDGNFSFHGGETITGVDVQKRKISAVHTDIQTYLPKIIIDCTGDIEVSQLAGCSTKMDTGLNGVTQVYRVTPKGYESIDAVPPEYAPPYNDPSFDRRLDEVRVISSVNTYPNGDLNINQLPTMDGDEFFSMERTEAEEVCRGRVYLHWRRLQEDSPFMRKYKINKIFPMIGIRESRRLEGRYILGIKDVLAGFRGQNHRDGIVAFSDHPIDIHGENGSGIRILDEPYGIPYDCFLPKEIDNLLVACRGSSFDRKAAASCRLSRTMISLGEAAGTAAVVSCDTRKNPCDADVVNIRELLGIWEFTNRLYDEFPGL